MAADDLPEIPDRFKGPRKDALEGMKPGPRQEYADALPDVPDRFQQGQGQQSQSGQRNLGLGGLGVGQAVQGLQSLVADPQGSAESMEKNIDSTVQFAKTPEGQRLIAEVLGGAAGSAVAPHLAIPRLFTVFGRAAPAIYRSVLAGSGSGAGSLAAESVDPSGSLQNAMQRAGETAAYGMAGDLGVSGLGAAGRKLIPNVSGKVNPKALESNELLKSAESTMTPGQLTDSNMVDFLENVTEASIFGGGTIKTARESAESGARSLVDDLANTFVQASDPAELGKRVQSVVNNEQQLWETASSKLFGKLDEVAEGQKVNIKPLKDQAKNVLKREYQTAEPNQRSIKMARQLLERPDSIDWQEAQQIRSRMLRTTRSASEGNPDIPVEYAKNYSKIMTDRMDEAAKSLPRGARSLWHTARDVHKKGAEAFRSDFFKTLTQQNPSEVFQTVKRGSAEDVANLRKIIGDENVWKNVQGEWIRDAVTSATRGADDRLYGNTLFNTWRKTPDTWKKELFPSEAERKRVDQVFRTMERTQSPASKDGSGTMVIQLVQPGQAMALGASGAAMMLGNDPYISGAGALGAAGVVFGPKAMAHLLTSKAGHKMFVEGLKAPAGSRQATRVLGQISAHLSNQGFEKGQDYRYLKNDESGNQEPQQNIRQ